MKKGSRRGDCDVPMAMCLTDAQLGRPVPNSLWQEQFGTSSEPSSWWIGFDESSAKIVRQIIPAALKRAESFRVEVTSLVTESFSGKL